MSELDLKVIAQLGRTCEVALRLAAKFKAAGDQRAFERWAYEAQLCSRTAFRIASPSA